MSIGFAMESTQIEMNKYETELVRNEIDQLLLVELSEEFWNDKENWPEWFKEKSHPLAANIKRPTDEDYDKGFIMYGDYIPRLTEEQEGLYEFDGWKPTLFYGYNHDGIWELTEDDAVGYSARQDKLIFGPKWMFDPFFVRVVE